jgi:chloramphenicol-sensitive protein RarD
LLFYLNPGLQMAWGVLVGHEPMPVGRWIGFGLIWVALAAMTMGSLRTTSARKRAAADFADDVDLPAPESSSR